MDTGTKLDGIVEREEMLDDEGNCTVKEGDTVELYVVGKDSGGIKLSRACPASAVWPCSKKPRQEACQ